MIIASGIKFSEFEAERYRVMKILNLLSTAVLRGIVIFGIWVYVLYGIKFIWYWDSLRQVEQAMHS